MDADQRSNGQPSTISAWRSVTSLAVIALVSAAGGVSAVVGAGMNWSIALPFASGAVAAMLLVSAFAHRFAGPRLQQAFAILAGCVAVGMAVKGIMAVAD